MRTKFQSGIRAALIALVMVLFLVSLGIFPAFASDGIEVESKYGKNGRIFFTVDTNGVMTWGEIPGATSYDLNIWTKHGLFMSETGLTSTRYNLVEKLNQYKKDSGTVEVDIQPKGVYGYADTAYFVYSSPYSKLEAPSNLRWDVYGNPDWDDVANADGYTLYLYQPSGSAYNHYDLATSYFTCTDYPDVATRVSDGWYFTVRATSTGDYRPSGYNESYRKGHIVGGGLRAESKQLLSVNENGMLLWNAVPGATSYDLNIWTKDGLFMAENGLVETSYPLQEKLIAYKKDSGSIKVSLIPKGGSASGCDEYFLYSSPYGKLEAPTTLYWDGNIARWSAVPGAEGYTIYLYQARGSAYNHWTTTETEFDFSTVANPGEDWFFTVKATAGNARDSVFTESPRKPANVSTTLYTIGAYVYDATLDTFDNGGQVYLDTSVGVMDWSISGDTLLAIEGTVVTVKAAPAPGYVFVEWRQGTKGQTISREATYSFTAATDKYLYAIFRERGDLEIAEVVGIIAEEHIPRAGLEVENFLPTIPDVREPYSRSWNGAQWRDENGVLIAPDSKQFYDLGYEFEAGRSYTTESFYFDAYNGYTFAEDITVHLEGPDPSMWDYEITGFNDNRTAMYVKFTFHIPGERDYQDINKVSMVYYGSEAEGAKMPDAVDLVYNNCAITREEWNRGTWGSVCAWDTSTGANRFAAGNTYVHMIELTALPGYKFSENLLVQKGRQAEEQFGVVQLSEDRTVATVTFTYPISEIQYLENIRLEPKAGNEHFYLIRQGKNLSGGGLFTTDYNFADAPYDTANIYKWFDVETGEEIYDITTVDLELGKKYRCQIYVDIKDEYEDTVRFDDDTTVVFYNYFPSIEDYVEIEVSTGKGATRLTLNVIYTVQPRVGEGKNPSYPVICYTYGEFKYAMENENIRYVALGNINERMPIGEQGLVTAIHVNGIKNLILTGDATFTAPTSDVTTYAALLHTTQNTTLNISGTGSLEFKAVANNSYNAVIYNQGGTVNISSGMLIGSYNTAVYGMAIWQDYGELNISGGQFNADNALAPLSQPRAATAVYINGGNAWIQDGTFRTRNWINTIDLPCGLQIGQNATVELTGGTFYGILLPNSTTPLANYMDKELYTAFSNENWFNPSSVYSQDYTASGKVVRIAWVIDHVDVHVNAPIAGVDIMTNYFNIPTSGCQATMYYPQWYKNGEPVTYGTFEAGESYKVVVQIEVKPGYSAEFPNNVTAAINNKSVAVDRMSPYWIEVEYDFGKCPNVVNFVELTATAPKEGNTPSYSIGSASNAYYAIGDTSNYTDYRQWYMSSDGEEWWPINSSHQFQSGYYYKLVADIHTKSGYEFALYDDGSRILPDVSATVNGYYASVYKAYDQDPSRYITVEYNFGECNDSIVEHIAVVDVVAPVAGQHPSYTYNILGTGYQMDISRNAYYDAYWLNPAEKWYYVKNGIGWLDVTDGGAEYVYEHDTFIPGHEYRCTVYLITEDGYEFAHTKDYEPTVTAALNGKEAGIVEGWTNRWETRVVYTFTCEQKDITAVMLYDLDEPQAGSIPDTQVTPAYPEYYTVESVEWFDIEDGPVGATFESGVPYYAKIVIASAKSGGSDISRFADAETLKIYINGDSGTYLEDCGTIENNKITLYVRYRKPSSAPIVVPYLFTTQPTGGTLSTGESYNAAWQTTFIPTRTEIQYWDGAAWDQWDVQYPESALDDYDFESAVSASYRFRIVAYIGNDAVASSNEFVITWVTECRYAYYPGEGSGMGISGIVTAGTKITLADAAMFTAPAGKQFKAWAIGSVNGEQKQPGEQITIQADTLIYAVWKEVPHTCVGTAQSGQNPTCTVDGWKAYYRCACGKFYEDAQCTLPISDLTAWKAGAGKIAAHHTYVDGKCSCGATDPALEKWQSGDANHDGKADSSDAVAILRNLAGYEVPNFYEDTADFNGDGKADSSDAVAILRKLAGY